MQTMGRTFSIVPSAHDLTPGVAHGLDAPVGILHSFGVRIHSLSILSNVLQCNNLSVDPSEARHEEGAKAKNQESCKFGASGACIGQSDGEFHKETDD